MRPRAPFVSAGLIALAACATSPDGPTTSGSAAGAAGYTLQVDGESMLLGQAGSSSMSLAEFAARVRQSTTAGRDDETRHLVRTYPDLAEQAILSGQVEQPAQQVVAAWMDGFANPAPGGWSLLVADMAENPRRYAAWQQQRATSWELLHRGAFAEVADRTIATPSAGPTPWPAVDAASLQATAMLVAGRPTQAAPLFEQVGRVAADWDRRRAIRANLYAALCYQLAGIPAGAAKARARATDTAALAAIQDPILLRLLLETHEAAGASATRFSRRATRARLARVEMQRGAPHAALLAWRAAETEPGAEPDLNHLRLGQAEALIGLGQDQPAIAMLAGLARTDVRGEALVMLGLVQLRLGRPDTALAVLREAVEHATASAQPEVYADAGLALLSSGNQRVGLSLLHQARDAFQARGDTHSLVQLLQNELRYAEAKGDALLAGQVRKRLLAVNLPSSSPDSL